MVIKNRNLFRITRFILLKLPLLFRFFARFRSPRKRLLIIKTDAIGDYVLFRNFIEVVKLSDRYKDYQIDLLGNTLWQELALKYDAQFINQFYFIRQYDLYEQPLKTLKSGWRLFRNNYEVVLQPSSTRLLITDGLAALAAAKQLIGFESDNEGIPQRYKAKTDKFYTYRLILPQNIYFEFDRSRFFFETVLKQVVELNGPAININTPNKRGIVIFPGAGIFKRGWEAEKFLTLIKLILAQTSERVYLAGGPGEIAIGNYLEDNLPHQNVLNLTGKTSLPQLVELIASAALVIANETSAIHLAAATQTKAVCILGGGHFGRFAPYPESMQSRPECLYQKMECYNCNWDCIYKTSEKEPYPCIAIISLEEVWQVVQPLLLQNV